MQHFIGLDVSTKETFVCIVNEKQKIVREEILPTEPELLAEYIHSLKLEIESVGLESGSLSHWLTEELMELQVPVKCIDARHASAFLSMKVNKTDRNDAQGIAEIMRCKAYKEVAIKKGEQRADLVLLKSRKAAVDQRVSLLNQIRGLIKPFGIRLGSISKTERGMDEILEKTKDLPEAAASGIKMLVELARVTIQAIRKIDTEVKAKAVQNPQAQVLMSIPGVGPVTALWYCCELGDPRRFKKSKAVGAYLGLTPKQYSSGETCRRGRISKQGSKELRSLLVEASLVHLRLTKSYSKLKAWGMRLSKRTGLKKAVTAMGRKLAVIMHRMSITGEVFRFTEKEAFQEAV